MNAKTLKLIIAAMSVGLLATACDPSIEGGEGNLVFTYDRGPVPATDSTPLAKNAQIDYTARTAGENGQAVTFKSAESSDSSVIAVTAGTNAVSAEGNEVGSSDISVIASGPDGEIEDFFEAEVVEADGMQINHLCTKEEEDPAAYLPGNPISLKYRLMESNRTAAGYGYYPVTIQPDTMATVEDAERMGFLNLALSSDTGTATVESDISESSFDVEVVEESSIDGAKMYFENLNLPVIVDETRLVFILPTASGLLGLDEPVTICQAENEIEVTSDTPDVCSAQIQGDYDFDGSFLNPYEKRAVELEGLSEGDCQYTVTFPNADGGNGFSKQFTTEVQPSDT